MAVRGGVAAKVIKIAAKKLAAIGAELNQAQATVRSLKEKIAALEKAAKAQALATRIVTGDDVRKEIDERAKKIAKEDLNVVEKALDLGRTEAILKIGEVLDSQESRSENTNKRNALIEFLSTLK